MPSSTKGLPEVWGHEFKVRNVSSHAELQESAGAGQVSGRVYAEVRVCQVSTGNTSGQESEKHMQRVFTKMEQEI